MLRAKETELGVLVVTSRSDVILLIYVSVLVQLYRCIDIDRASYDLINLV